MSNKLTKKERMARALVGAIPAMLFAGSAMATVATATGLAVPFAGLYLAAGVAVALCALGATSAGGAALAALLYAATAVIYGVSNAAGLGAVRELLADWGGEAGDAARIALGGRTLMTGGAYVLAVLFFALLNRREFVSVAVTILLSALVACHAMSEDASLAASVPGLVAAAAAFAMTGGLPREPAALRALLPAALAVAAALMLTPAGRATWPPLEEAANRVRSVFEQYFSFTQQRVAFSINEQGYDHAGEVGGSVVSMLGGPATPHTDPVMSVRTDAQALLRGAIRTAYTGYSWVDAAPKSRYLYIDFTHRAIRDRVFSPGPALGADATLEADVSVEMLGEGTSTLFVPALLRDFEMDLSTAVYYNTAGEMFLTRGVQPGDSYRLRGLLTAPGDALRAAVLEGEAASDDRWQAALEGHTQLPDCVESGVYALTMQVIQGADNPYDRAAAIMRYLGRSTRYTLTPAYPPMGRDYVSWFLLDAREGYCSAYATAMAVMGRIAGLPTRYVEGYLARPGESVLTGENAHAWAEVYFRGVGWVPFDATGGATGSGGEAQGGEDQPGLDGGARDEGGRQSEDQPGSDAGGEGAAAPEPGPDGGAEDGTDPAGTPEPPDGGTEDENEPAETPEPPEGVPEGAGDEAGRRSSGPWPWLAALLLALVALAALWVRSRLRRSDPARLCEGARDNREAALALYRANLTALSHMGQTPVNGEAPEVFAARVSAAFNNPDFAAFTGAVARSSYGNRPLRGEDVKRGLRAYGRFRDAMGPRERLRFALTRVMHGLGDFESIP